MVLSCFIKFKDARVSVSIPLSLRGNLSLDGVLQLVYCSEPSLSKGTGYTASDRSARNLDGLLPAKAGPFPEQPAPF